jgi:hypothetical protein
MLSPASLEADKPIIPAQASIPAKKQRAFAIKVKSDVSRLQLVRSREQKNALKRDLLNEYQDYLRPLIKGDAVSTGQDIALVWCALWSIDIGEFKQGLALALLALKGGMNAPDGFKRNLVEIFTENLTNHCLANNPIYYLDDLEVLREAVEHDDMQDSVKGKLFKALGIGYFEVDRVKATQYLERSLQLNPIGGAKAHLKALNQYHASKSDKASKGTEKQHIKKDLVERSYTLSTVKAAKWVGVSIPTFLRWARVHNLPAMRVTCGKGLGFRFDQRDVETLKQSLIVK